MSIIGPDMTLAGYGSGQDTPIKVFEGRITFWVLAFARLLSKEKDSGIAVLLLASSVIEPMGGALRGGGNPKKKFCAGFQRTFPNIPGSGNAQETGEKVCRLLRDGLFHESFFKAGLILHRLDVLIRVEAVVIQIDPVRFLKSVEDAFASVCKEVRTAENNATVQKFEAYWRKQTEDQGRYAKAHLGTLSEACSGATVSTPDPRSILFGMPDGTVFKTE